MKKITLVISTIIALLIVIAITWYRIGLVTPSTKQSQAIQFEIPQGTPSKTIANELKKQNIINSPGIFLFYIKLNGITLQSGLYTLDPSKPMTVIADNIGTGKVSDYQITIPEGWRAEQIAQVLAKQKIVSYQQFMEAAQGKEGKLFPDTYRLSVKTSADQIVAKLEKNFERRLKEAGIEKLSNDNLIIASIVEHEAKKDEDRPKMAGVYKNRLALGMPLEADPTVQYAVDSSTVAQLDSSAVLDYEFWKPITAEQNKNFESLYNTYRHKGLPPGPIANPGLKAIKAAVNPEKHNFFYFFNLNDGTTIYSKTRDEHDANRRKHGV